MDPAVYMVDIATLLPPRYRPDEVISRVYGQAGMARDIAVFANRAGRHVGVKSRSSVLDFDAYPNKRLISDCHTPKAWCCALIDALTAALPPERLGFLGVSYNVTSHVDVLPNLACQVARERRLRLAAPPQELPHYGCASAILQIQAAAAFCKAANQAALVITLEQCTWAFDPVSRKDDDDFAASLRAHLLFSDGAAAVLLVPGSMASRFPTALRIIEVGTGFRLGNAIGMKDGRFLVGEDVKGTMPELVASECVAPLLRRRGLSSADVRDWAIHQGGLPVLARFKEPSILGLTDVQLADSVQSFADFGNLSSASCLFTLRRQFERSTNAPSFGMAVAFGAGYYFGSFLYEKCDPAARATKACRRSPASSPPDGDRTTCIPDRRRAHVRACLRARLGTRCAHLRGGAGAKAGKARRP